MELSEKAIRYLLTLNGWCVREKMIRLYNLVIETDAQVIVEAGTFAGRSAFPMAMACRDKESGHLLALDAWSNEVAVEGEEISRENTEWWSNLDMRHIFQSFVKSLSFLGLQDYMHWQKAKSYEVAEKFEDGSVDILHQDSQHNTHTIVRELEAWAPKMKIGGYWITDDEDWGSTHEGYSKLPDYGFEKVEHHKIEVPNTNPQQYTEFAIYKKVR